MLHELNKTKTTNTTIHDLFLYFKICCVKKKIKIRSVSKEDTNQFFFKKNSDMHLMKI